MRRKFLSVVLCVCMMLTMAPFAFAEGTESSSGSGSGSPTFNGLITTADALQEAINTATDNTTITVSGTIEISAPIDIDDTITITGTNNAEIKASNEFSGGYLIGLKTTDKTLTLGNIKLNANEKARVVYCSAGSLVVDGATITGGKTASSYIGGVYMTNNSMFEMESGSITGNKVSDRYASDGYLQYSADLWIGANVTAGLAGGEVSNVFVNANSYSKTDPGCFIMQAGHVTNLYAEYCDTYGAQVIYGDATLDHLYLSTIEGNGDKVEITSPVIGMTYTGGQTSDDALTPVAQVGTTTYGTLKAAIAATTDGQTVTLLKNATENVNISAEKSVTINLNGYTVTVPSDCGIELQGKLTVTGNGKITCANTPICVDGSSAELTVNAGTIESTNDYGIYAKNGGSVVVNGGTISSKNAALSGNNTTGSMNFTVNSGTLTAAQGPAIYMPGQVSLNISGGTLNGGVSLRMGQVNISGGVINAITENIDSPSQYYNYSGNAWLPDALYVFGGTYSDGDTEHGNSLNLNITGGIFNCTNGQGSAVAIYDIGKVAQSANVTISGNAKLATNASSRSAYQVLSLADIGVNSPANGYGKTEYTNKVKSSITGGYFTTAPTAYCGKDTQGNQLTGIPSNDSTYPFTVGTLTANVDVATADPAVKTPSNIDSMPDAEKAVVNNAVSAAAGTTATGLDAIGGKEATNVTSSEVNTAKEQLSKTSGVTINTGDSVTLYVQPYLAITVTGAEVASGATEGSTTTTSLSLNITPMVKKVASTAENANAIVTSGDSKNAVEIGTPMKVTNVNTPVTIKLALPTGFAQDGDKLSIKHTKENGSVEYYTGTVSTEGEEGSAKTYVTFTTNGFSPFVIYAASANVASIGNNVYPSFQAAVDAAQNNDEITLLKGDAVSATMTGSSKTIKVKAGSGVTTPINVTVNGESKTLDNGTAEVTFTYTRPSSGGPGSSGGSISAPTTYAVNVNAATNGAVAADKKTASKGTTVTVTASPSKGYVVDAVKVVDKDGKDVAVTGKDGKYVFTMPGSAVTVTGTFKAETPAPVALPFTDVKSGNWFYDAVKYAYAQGLMTGTSATTFAPNGTMNRAMIVTVLYRLEKSPAVTGASKFTDVPAGQWYSDAVAWAAANKIVNGYDETTFGPMNAVTREQMAAILFRYEQVKGLENVTLEENLNRFPDQNKISAYAIPALQWAVGQKIINGNADGTLDPTGTATRAQVAQIFTNLLNK